MDIPTVIAEPYSNYKRSKALNDPFVKFKYLEYTWSALIKYIAITFAALAKETDANLYGQMLLKIFSSSSLGAWVDSMALMCREKEKLDDRAKEYLAFFNIAKKHPRRTELQELETQMSKIFAKLTRKGYLIRDVGAMSILRLFSHVVEIRNKVAHGALDVTFYDEVEDPYCDVLSKLLYMIIPFSDFTMYAARGRFVHKLISVTPPLVTTSPMGNVWFQSRFLTAPSKDIPLMFYNSESEEIYLLNDKVEERDKESEFICYKNGNIRYSQIIFMWSNFRIQEFATPRVTFEAYQQSKELLLNKAIHWRKLDLAVASLDALAAVPAVYVFYIEVHLLEETITHVLYVGKTSDIKDRFRSYLGISKQYYDNRPEIGRMFQAFGAELKFKYAKALSEPDARSLELAIYQTLKPEFNTNTPPKLR